MVVWGWGPIKQTSLMSETLFLARNGTSMLLNASNMRKMVKKYYEEARWAIRCAGLPAPYLYRARTMPMTVYYEEGSDEHSNIPCGFCHLCDTMLKTQA